MINIERVGLRGPAIREFGNLHTGDIFVLNGGKWFGKESGKPLWMKVENDRALLFETGKFADLDSKRLVRVVRAKITYEDHDEWDPRAVTETPAPKGE